jgi:hypothetical protein
MEIISFQSSRTIRRRKSISPRASPRASRVKKGLKKFFSFRRENASGLYLTLSPSIETVDSDVSPTSINAEDVAPTTFTDETKAATVAAFVPTTHNKSGLYLTFSPSTETVDSVSPTCTNAEDVAPNTFTDEIKAASVAAFASTTHMRDDEDEPNSVTTESNTVKNNTEAFLSEYNKTSDDLTPISVEDEEPIEDVVGGGNELELSWTPESITAETNNEVFLSGNNKTSNDMTPTSVKDEEPIEDIAGGGSNVLELSRKYRIPSRYKVVFTPSIDIPKSPSSLSDSNNSPRSWASSPSMNEMAFIEDVKAATNAKDVIMKRAYYYLNGSLAVVKPFTASGITKHRGLQHVSIYFSGALVGVSLLALLLLGTGIALYTSGAIGSINLTSILPSKEEWMSGALDSIDLSTLWCPKELEKVSFGLLFRQVIYMCSPCLFVW